eukprot:SAG31_NODE_100_length_25264_cov_38.715359_15_plen_38_part_00
MAEQEINELAVHLELGEKEFNLDFAAIEVNCTALYME